MNFFLAVLVLLINPLAQAQLNCESNKEAIYSDSKIFFTPKFLNTTESIQAEKLITRIQDQVYLSLLESQEVMHDLQTCFEEMGSRWTNATLSRCQNLKRFEPLQYKALMYNKMPSLYKAFRINLALAIKPKHKHNNQLPATDWINFNLEKTLEWPDEISPQEPLLSSPISNNEAKVATEELTFHVKKIIIDYLFKVNSNNTSNEDLASLTTMLRSALKSEDPNQILKIVEVDMRKFKYYNEVENWLSYFYAQMRAFRQERLQQVYNIMSAFRPIAKIGKALPLPQDFSEVFKQTILINSRVTEKILNDKKTLQELFKLNRSSNVFVKVDQIDEIVSMYINNTYFVNKVVQEKSEFCDIAYRLLYRDQLNTRNSTIEFIFITLVSGYYIRPAIMAAGFLGLSVYDIHKSNKGLAEAQDMFFSFLSSENSFNKIEDVLGARESRNLSYYLLPLTVPGLSPIAKNLKNIKNIHFDELKKTITGLQVFTKNEGATIYRYKDYLGNTGFLAAIK